MRSIVISIRFASRSIFKELSSLIINPPLAIGEENVINSRQEKTDNDFSIRKNKKTCRGCSTSFMANAFWQLLPR